jgi:hypothetical protein
VVVEHEPDLIAVEGDGPVDVADGDDDHLERPLHRIIMRHDGPPTNVRRSTGSPWPSQLTPAMMEAPRDRGLEEARRQTARPDLCAQAVGQWLDETGT